MGQLSIEHKRSNVEIDIASQSYLKTYDDLNCMIHEVTALEACKGEGIQQIKESNVQEQWIRFQYDKNSYSFLELAPSKSIIFVEQLPSIIKSISHCHKCGWVHGDIKPSNIIFSPLNQTIRIIDFGASHKIGTQRQSLNEWQCTPSFASEKALKGKGCYLPTDDWYALIKMIDQFISSDLSWHIKFRAKIYKKWIMYRYL